MTITHTDRNGHDVSTWAGFKYSTIARSTGALVVVVDNRNDAWETGNEDKWLTICDRHSTVCSHRTHRLARDHAAAPEGWCEDCQSGVEPTIIVQVEQPAPRVERNYDEHACNIDGTHCESCGSTDYEDVHCGDQGYTACCNELISYDRQGCRNHHGV